MTPFQLLGSAQAPGSSPVGGLGPSLAASRFVVWAEAVWLRGMIRAAMAATSAGITRLGLTRCAVRAMFTAVSPCPDDAERPFARKRGVQGRTLFRTVRREAGSGYQERYCTSVSDVFGHGRSEMNQQRDLEGVAALVTGATSGIGRAAAEELGRHGAEVVVHGRDAARGSVVVDSILGQGGQARFVAADLTAVAQLDDLVDRAGPVDVLVNNAGFSWFGPTADLDAATFDRLVAAAVRGAGFLV